MTNRTFALCTAAYVAGVGIGPAILLGGCSSDLSEPSSARRVFALAGPEHVETIRRFHDERQSAIADCMTAAGFEYTPEAFEQGPYLVTRPAEVAVLTVEVAVELGYGVEAGARFAFNLRATANDRYHERLDPAAAAAYETALLGDDPAETDGGCTGAAEEHLVATFDDYVPTSALAELEAQLEQYVTLFEQRSERLWSRWSRCMSAAGYEYASTFAARDDVRGRWESGELDLDTGELHEYEFPRAVADARCQAPLLEDFRDVDLTIQTDVFGEVVASS